MRKNVLVVAAHADDEVLGCGGTIARHVAEGDVVNVVFLSDGITSRNDAVSSDLQRREAAASSAQAILGIQRIQHLGLPDNRLDSLPLLEIVQKLEDVVRELSPQVIYTHHCGDLNLDHRIAHQAVMTACRPLPGCTWREIYGFEVLSSTEWSTSQFEPFKPNVFVDISEHLSTKQKALEAYVDEIRDVPHTRSIEHANVLARHRGYSVGIDAAEAFELLRMIR